MLNQRHRKKEQLIISHDCSRHLPPVGLQADSRLLIVKNVGENADAWEMNKLV